MPDLAQLQRQMAAAILAGDFSALAREFNAGVGRPEARLAIHRNNTYLSLTEALKVTFPVTVELVDARFFAYAADRFIAAHPPLEARLSRYGQEFPRFLSRFPASRRFPLAAEMATFEWAMAQANVAAIEPRADLARLQSLAQSRSLVLQPSLHFALSHWPIERIWLAHRRDTVESEKPFARETRRLAVHRTGDGLQFITLSRSRFAFWRQLRRGRSVEKALSCALAHDPMFDLLNELLALIGEGLITGAYSQTAIHRTKKEFFP